MRYTESKLADLSDDKMTDELIVQLWREVESLHTVGIAHRSLRMANVMVDATLDPGSSTSASPGSTPAGD